MIHEPVVAVVSFTTFLAAVTIDEKSLVPVGSAISVCIGVWWMGRKLQRIEDRQEEMARRMDDLQCIKNRGCKID